MKLKLNLIFIVIILCLAVACIVHTTVSYVSIANDEMTSAPPEVAFFLIIPYAFFMLISAICWLITVRIYKKHKKETEKNAI